MVYSDLLHTSRAPLGARTRTAARKRSQNLSATGLQFPSERAQGSNNSKPRGRRNEYHLRVGSHESGPDRRGCDMNVILCIFLIAAIVFLFFTLCAFALQAQRAALPTYEVPPTAYSYQIDRQTDDLERCVVKYAPASGNPHQHIWVINVTNGRAAFCADENRPRGDSRGPSRSSVA